MDIKKTFNALLHTTARMSKMYLKGAAIVLPVSLGTQAIATGVFNLIGIDTLGKRELEKQSWKNYQVEIKPFFVPYIINSAVIQLTFGGLIQNGLMGRALGKIAPKSYEKSLDTPLGKICRIAATSLIYAGWVYSSIARDTYHKSYESHLLYTTTSEHIVPGEHGFALASAVNAFIQRFLLGGLSELTGTHIPSIIAGCFDTPYMKII